MKHIRFLWSTEAQQAYETLNLALTEAPVLALPKYEPHFKIITDA